MDYVHPLEGLSEKIRLYQCLAVALMAVLLYCIIAVPIFVNKQNTVVVNQNGLATLEAQEPWTMTTARIEGFLKFYLTNRFDWSKENFDRKKTSLEIITKEEIFQKLKDSLNTYDHLAKDQSGKSYYLLEGYGFSNAAHKIEATIIRVIRIRTATVAIPMSIALQYEDTALTKDNPYGLKITGVEEIDASTTTAPRSNQ